MPQNSINRLCVTHELNINVFIELLLICGTQSGTGTGC